jgi:predicted RNA-binding protein with PUA-like domain
MNYWLMKSDVEDYPLEKFIKDKVTPWEGVRNYQARNFMMKDMKVGDRGIFYLSNANPSSAMAVLEVVSEAKPDKLAQNKKSEYFDPKATKENPIWFCVDVKFVKKLASPVSLDQLRAEKSLATMRLLQRGNRLSILPLTKVEFLKICQMGGLESDPAL